MHATPSSGDRFLGRRIVRRRGLFVTIFVWAATLVTLPLGGVIFRMLFGLVAGEFGRSWDVFTFQMPLTLVAAAIWVVLPLTAIKRVVRSKRPFLILDENGVTIPDKRNRLVLWDDISGVDTVYFGRKIYLELQLTPTARSKLSKVEQLLSGASSGGILLAISLRGIDLAEDPFNAVKSYFEHVGGNAACRVPH